MAGGERSEMVYATRKFTFSAAHRYWRDEWTAEENARVFGNLTAAHGHNYVLEGTVRGPVDPRTGMVMDLGELKRLVGEAVIARFDHADLNHGAPFPAGGKPPPPAPGRGARGTVATHAGADA